MAVKSVRKIYTQDEELNRVQDTVKSAVDPLLANSFVSGMQFIDATLAAASATIVAHSLGRLPLGWLLVDKNATGDVYRTAWTTTTITLYNTGAGAISAKIGVF